LEEEAGDVGKITDWGPRNFVENEIFIGVWNKMGGNVIWTIRWIDDNLVLHDSQSN